MIVYVLSITQVIASHVHKLISIHVAISFRISLALVIGQTRSDNRRRMVMDISSVCWIIMRRWHTVVIWKRKRKEKREKRKEKREEGEERDNRGNCDLHRFPNGKACPISTLYRATLLYAFAP